VEKQELSSIAGGKVKCYRATKINMAATQKLNMIIIGSSNSTSYSSREMQTAVHKEAYIQIFIGALPIIAPNVETIQISINR
jgi:hypothetical protein